MWNKTRRVMHAGQHVQTWNTMTVQWVHFFRTRLSHKAMPVWVRDKALKDHFTWCEAQCEELNKMKKHKRSLHPSPFALFPTRPKLIVVSCVYWIQFLSKYLPTYMSKAKKSNVVGECWGTPSMKITPASRPKPQSTGTEFLTHILAAVPWCPGGDLLL